MWLSNIPLDGQPVVPRIPQLQPWFLVGWPATDMAKTVDERISLWFDKGRLSSLR